MDGVGEEGKWCEELIGRYCCNLMGANVVCMCELSIFVNLYRNIQCGSSQPRLTRNRLVRLWGCNDVQRILGEKDSFLKPCFWCYLIGTWTYLVDHR